MPLRDPSLNYHCYEIKAEYTKLKIGPYPRHYALSLVFLQELR